MIRVSVSGNRHNIDGPGPGGRNHVVIVGAGFGGLETVHRLAGARVSITLIDQRNHHLFQPLLYQVASATLSPADIAGPIRSIFSRARNVRVILDSVTGVDPLRNGVQLAGGEPDQARDRTDLADQLGRCGIRHGDDLVGDRFDFREAACIRNSRSASASALVSASEASAE